MRHIVATVEMVPLLLVPLMRTALLPALSKTLPTSLKNPKVPLLLTALPLAQRVERLAMGQGAQSVMRRGSLSNVA
jgi:hypothetical protein